MSVATVDVYCHCRCLFIVIPYNRINLNHDRINLNLVGAPRGPLTVGGPLVIALTLPYVHVRYATDYEERLDLLHFQAFLTSAEFARN